MALACLSSGSLGAELGEDGVPLPERGCRYPVLRTRDAVFGERVSYLEGNKDLSVSDVLSPQEQKVLGPWHLTK